MSPQIIPEAGLQRILEAVLFAAGEPLRLEQIACAVPDRTPDEIEAALEALRETYEREGRGWQLVALADGWQILSHPALYSYVERFLEGRRRARLSRAALESLAVIAYQQPITRGELEDLRGVDCGGVLHTLLEREMITVRGRSSALGRPLLYGTTDRFLEHFGLSSLGALPRLEEIESLWASDEVRLQLEAEAQRRLGPEDAVGPDVEEGTNGHDPAGMPALVLVSDNGSESLSGNGHEPTPGFSIEDGNEG